MLKLPRVGRSGPLGFTLAGGALGLSSESFRHLLVSLFIILTNNSLDHVHQVQSCSPRSSTAYSRSPTEDLGPVQEPEGKWKVRRQDRCRDGCRELEGDWVRFDQPPIAVLLLIQINADARRRACWLGKVRSLSLDGAPRRRGELLLRLSLLTLSNRCQARLRDGLQRRVTASAEEGSRVEVFPRQGPSRANFRMPFILTDPLIRQFTRSPASKPTQPTKRPSKQSANEPSPKPAVSTPFLPTLESLE